MDEEWRVCLVVHGPLTVGKPVAADAVRDRLRGRVGEGISVTTGRTGIFLYAATADAAAAAGGRAQEVLAEQGLAGDIRLERWDLSGQAWVDARAKPGEAAASGVPSGHGSKRGWRRLISASDVVAAIIDGISNAWP